jgi:mannose-6-phosphate isomerase-like protein (cupin superfamily)
MTVKQEINAQTKKGENFSAVHLGKMSNLDSYELHVPRLNRTVRGKVFIKDLLSFTGMQISVNKLPAGASGICHQHKENEEAYIFIKGKGQMQIDKETFDVEEGSIVRVNTQGSRCVRNNSSEELQYICVQAKENSLNIDTFEDGIPATDPVTWPN